MTAPEPHHLTIVGRTEGESRDGYLRVYLTPDESQYVEIAEAGLLSSAPNDERDRPPFFGDRATELTVAGGTEVVFTSRHIAPTPEETIVQLEAKNFVDWTKNPLLPDLLTPCWPTRWYCGY